MRLAILSLAILATGCSDGGTSTAEVRQAAIERAREEFNLAADAPLEASVWAGSEYEGEPSVCGTVSSSAGGMQPQRFMARPDPIRWLVFEDAHASTVPSQPDKFPEWSRFCGASAPSN